VGDMEIDLIRRRVRRGNVRIDLTAQEFTLVKLLAERQGEVVTRAVVTSQVWDMNFDSDTNVVEVAVRR
ncbi:winged helix-turn-helix domain-containing protein, partial [Escherichia coli]|nr:winged helix-turn-helix domain-containing protein [Escherichia coli]